MSDAASLPVVIVGGGFSGAMLAARLAEQGQASILIERSDAPGAGVAYSTLDDAHRLNVRANRMGAVADHPDDFVDWLVEHALEQADPHGFAPRSLYGRYVRDRLAAGERTGLIRVVRGEATRVDGTAVVLDDASRIGGRSVVLATGNPAPRAAGRAPRLVSDPWAPAALDRVGAFDSIVVLGAGLTMVDVLLGLQGRGWRGAALAVSRRGLLPRAHADRHDAPVELSSAEASGPLSRRLHAARRLARTHGWRRVMEGYRPITAALWRSATAAERRRFLRHLRPWWDVHRHRLAPEIAGVLDRLLEEGRLTVRAARVRRIEATEADVMLEIAPRGGGRTEILSAHWLIDCTGPGHDPARAPLTAGLIASGRARIDPAGLGLDLDAEGRVLHADGRADPALFVLGPPARAAFWETVAVPDIRQRIEALAAILRRPG